MALVILTEIAQEETELLCAALEGAGHRVATAATARDVLSRAAQADVLIADVEFPPDGLLALMEQLRGTAGPDRPAVLALCTSASVSQAHQAVQQGARDYCLRPVQMERFLTKVDLAARSAAHVAAAAEALVVERRSHPRKPVSAPIQVVIEGITMDISEGGMRIAAPVEMSDDLVITIVSEFISQLTGTPNKEVRCRIVHHHRLNGRYAYGVSFIQLDDQIRQAIRRWAASHDLTG